MAIETNREVIRERLSKIGKSSTDVARELGVSVAVVRGVLDGRFKGNRGDAHKVAVALGLKDGVAVRDGSSVVDALKALAA